MKKVVGFLLYDNFTALDLFGPLEALHSSLGQGGIHYEIKLIANSNRLFEADSGVKVMPDETFADASSLDILIVPGGKGTRNAEVQKVLCPWLAKNANNIARVFSICTGVFLLAEAGLVDNQTVTTHWMHAENFRTKYPHVHLQEDALYIQNSHISSSAGISAGIDLALKIIEDDNGCDIAAKVARFLVVHYRRSGDQAQFSEPLKFQQKANSAFSSLVGWIMNHLGDDLSSQTLAEKAGMSERHFYRKFKQHMGVSPAHYVERLRLDYARQLLIEKSWPNKRIAQACGYSQVDVFRRAFERRFSTTPKEYKNRFSQ